MGSVPLTATVLDTLGAKLSFAGTAESEAILPDVSSSQQLHHVPQRHS